MSNFYVAGSASRQPFIDELVAGLRAKGWSIFDSRADVAPGDDAAVLRQSAARAGDWRILVLDSRDLDESLHDEVHAAMREFRSDPASVRVIPVLFGPSLEARGFSGLQQLLPLHHPTAEEAIQRIDSIAGHHKLGHPARRQGRLFLVGHRKELGDVLEQWATELGRTPTIGGVDIIDLEDGRLPLSAGPFATVVLVGASTFGGTGAEWIRALAGDVAHTVVIALEPVPRTLLRAWRDDHFLRMDLLDEVPHIETPSWDVGHGPVRQAIGRLIEDQLPAMPGGSTVLHDWETRYLTGKRGRWERGVTDALSTLAKNNRLLRASLYVSLHAESGRWMRLEEDSVEVLLREEWDLVRAGLGDAGAELFRKRDDDIDARLDRVRQRATHRGLDPDRVEHLCRTLHECEGKSAPIFLDELLSHPSLPPALDGQCSNYGPDRTIFRQ